MSESLFTAVRRTLLPLSVALRLVLFVSDVPTVLAAASNDVTATRVVSAQVFAQDDLLSLTNVARAAAGQAPLVLSEELSRAAQAKAMDMAAKGYWDHFRPTDGKAPWDFIEEAGYDYKVAGENLARGFQTPAGITAAWLNSPAHRANLLSGKYVEVGFATVRAIGNDGQPVLLTVQMFGTR